MAIIGTNTINVNSGNYNNAYKYKVDINETSYNEANNTSDVTITFYIQAVSEYYNSYADSDATFRITSTNGASITADSNIRGTHSTSYNSWTTIGSYSGTFTHKDDGTLGITATVVYGWSSPAYLPRSTSISASGNCTTIKRDPMLKFKVGGSWKSGKVYIKVNGAWKKAKKIFVKVNGAWKESALKG